MENAAYPCPACGAPADLVAGCSGCGRPPYPPAAEVIRLDREIAVLGMEVERAHRAYQEVTDRLGAARRRREELAAAVRAAFPVAGRPKPDSAGPGASVPSRPGGAETSTRTVQGVLFVLGGLLLGIAAVVFTAVAWATVGVAGRALILAVVTAVTLAVPLWAVRRALRGTAETIAAVGGLLVLLDGYAAWTVDLGGVAGWPGTRYAALVGGASAAVAAGYARLSRLTGPWFIALVAVQPVLPLAAAEFQPSAGGWAVLLVGQAVVNLLVVAALRCVRTSTRGSAVSAGRAVAWLGYAVTMVLAAGCGLVPLAVGRFAGTPLLAGLPLLQVAVTLLAAAVLAGHRLFRDIAAGLLVPTLAVAALRPAAELREGLLLALSALVVLALAGGVRLLPPGWRGGPRAGALVVAGVLAQVTAVTVAVLASGAVARSFPPWRGAGPGPALAWGWQLPVAAAATVVAVGLLLPRAARLPLATVGAAVTVLAAPAGWAAVPWVAVVALDLAAAVGLLAVAVGRRPAGPGRVLSSAGAGAVLLGHALLVGLAAPSGAGAALAVTGAAGLAVAALGRRRGAVQRAVAGVALTTALLVVPAGAALAAFAGGASPWWQARTALAAAALLPAALVAVRRHWPDLRRYASTALAAAAVPVGVSPLAVPGDEPVAPYAAAAALLAAAGLVLAGGNPLLRAAGVVLSVVAVAVLVPVVLATLLAPYGGVWSGAPAVGSVPDAVPAGPALLLLGAAVATGRLLPAPGRPGTGGAAAAGAWWRGAPAAAPLLATALPVLLRAAGAPWPVVPAGTLLLGCAAVLAAALLEPRPLLLPVVLPLGLVFTGSGLFGLLATRAGTLTGLGTLVVTASVVAIAARPVAARLAGCLAAALAATALAVAVPLAGGLPLRTAAFTVLAVAVCLLAAAAVVAPTTAGGAATEGTAAAGRPAMAAVGQALDAAAQGVALVAFLLAAGALRHAAAVCALWGAAVGLRLLRRGEPVARRWAFAAVVGGSELLGTWLLLAAGGVAVLEAYTLPAAALALAAGAAALRTRSDLTSWLALGPGLAAGLLPPLASVLVAPDPQPMRRLLLGLAALGAVFVGATRRWQAPVVLGALTLTPLALHELARTWDLLPRWIFLAAGGLALIGLAATYERRRRDLARLRAAVGRMG
ncbi:hypothetical protein QTQ03_13615 [Micromonospora sp. WMMA1363]|uniref:SCO7613 C-terminal domain-containing membrane protein n=1 Tax=Micromonospora sp. WMMA1363 TaxID=3053985 RepID=UPI00259CC529|nr:hypothetical protein [Micromonospora sp. WMMA1363]MDM4720567.1 hypothetical protein [Micromonospora sp. WMMA1363]